MRWWNGSRSPPRAVERPFKKLVIEGLQHVLGSGEASASMRAEALARLRLGLRLGGHPLSRESAHERNPVR